MSAQQSETQSESSPRQAPSSAPVVRKVVLFAALFVSICILLYDRRIARPGVESAYNVVGQLNERVNAKPGSEYVTEKEVQEVLNRKPSKTYQEGEYQIEVYQLGIPVVRPRYYYAVYTAGSPMIFLKHYQYELPQEELVDPATRAAMAAKSGKREAGTEGLAPDPMANVVPHEHSAEEGHAKEGKGEATDAQPTPAESPTEATSDAEVKSEAAVAEKPADTPAAEPKPAEPAPAEPKPAEAPSEPTEPKSESAPAPADGT